MFNSLLLAVAVSSQPISSPVFTARVTSVTDGDTFRATINESEIVVRLGCIDSVERKQPGGDNSKQALSKLLPPGQVVELHAVSTDFYGRSVALVKTQSQFVNLLQVQTGHALIYEQYFKQCKTMKSQFQNAQSDAKRSHLGFWGLPTEQQVVPWEWRKLRKSKAKND